ncbi:MAG: glycosyltransferase family 2 protein [Cryobacterium sp.]
MVQEKFAISVALCTHNGARFVEEQLRSILEQSWPASEIVISDDASTDGTLGVIDRVLRDWRLEQPEVVLKTSVLRNSVALGVTANFEQALVATTGDLIALSDQDDVWLPDRLERMASEFARRPELVLLHADARLVDGAGAPLGVSLLETLGVSAVDRAAVHRGEALDVLLRRNIVTGATVMVRRSVLDCARPFPASWVHDEWLAMVAAATGVVDLLEVSLTDYRQHGANQIGVTRLNAAGRMGRLTAPRTARNARLRDRAADLTERAPALDPRPDPVVLSKFASKLRHEDMRSALPESRVRRILPVVRMWRRGGYRHFGLGAQDVLRDLIQPV